MMRSHPVAALCLAWALAGSGPATAQKLPPSPKGTAMNPIEAPLPFGLKTSDLSKVEVMYAFYSAKTGAGRQELTINGNGMVRLLFTRNRDAAPTIREAQVHPQVVATLLEFLADQSFLGFSDHYPSHHDHPHARRVLRLVLPNQTKTVLLDEPGFPAFEMVAGAVKFAASLGQPETLGHKFFPNL